MSETTSGPGLVSSTAPAAPRSSAFEALQQAEDGLEPRAATQADAFRAAVNMFLQETRFDMGRLADTAQISKATLYRWTGSREHLLGEVITYLSRQIFDGIVESTKHLRGIERVLETDRQFIEAVVSAEPLRRFLRDETRLALRILTTRGGTVQGGAVKMVSEVLEFEHEEHGMILRAPPDVLSYTVVRLTEGFIYTDPVAEIQPDVDTAVQMLELLMGTPSA